MLEVHLRHLQHISAVGQEHIPTLAVFRHVLVFALLEGFQLRRIIALNPAGSLSLIIINEWFCTYLVGVNRPTPLI